MFGEITKTIKANLYDRATSPLLGAFIISWTFWNYRFFAVIFSTISPQEKFQLLEEVIFISTKNIILQGGVYPALTTAFFLFIYPHPARVVFEYWRKEQSKLKAIRQRIEDETPLTVEEARIIRREALELENNYEKEIESKNQEIKKLKTNIEALKESLNTAPDIVNAEFKDKDSSMPSEEQVRLLKVISTHEGKMPEKYIFNESKTSRVKTEYDLGELLKYEFLKKVYLQSQKDYCYELTHKGRTTLVTLGHA